MAIDRYLHRRRGWLGSGPDTLSAFHGTLINSKQDAVGTLYRRNRQYDPSTGRFTQEDPIGFAGGLNLYGYASGDPINFSDPFGLCPRAAGGDGKTLRYEDCPEGTSGYAAYQSSRTSFSAEGTRLLQVAEETPVHPRLSPRSGPQSRMPRSCLVGGLGPRGTSEQGCVRIEAHGTRLNSRGRRPCMERLLLRRLRSRALVDL